MASIGAGPEGVASKPRGVRLTSPHDISAWAHHRTAPDYPGLTRAADQPRRAPTPHPGRILVPIGRAPVQVRYRSGSRRVETSQRQLTPTRSSATGRSTSALVERRPTNNGKCPRRAGWSPGWWACHPADLPPGYHPDNRGRNLTTSAGGCVEGRPRPPARSACSRSTGWHSASTGERLAPGHTGGHIRPGTARYPLTRRDSGRAGDEARRAGRAGRGRARFGACLRSTSVRPSPRADVTQGRQVTTVRP